MIRKMHKKDPKTNIIKVNFRKKKLSIDNDSYLNGVTKIHCRLCLKQKERIGAMELLVIWGYICMDCINRVEVEGLKSDKGMNKTCRRKISNK